MKAAAITLVFFGMSYLLPQMTNHGQFERVAHSSRVMIQRQPTCHIPVSGLQPCLAPGRDREQYESWHRNEPPRLPARPPEASRIEGRAQVPGRIMAFSRCAA